MLIDAGLQLDCMGWLTVSIQDDGRGMQEADVVACRDPFYTTRKTRKAGLGIPLIEQHSRASGGSFEMQSVPQTGTRLTFAWNLRHPDALPAGDLVSCFLDVMLLFDGVRFRMELIWNDQVCLWDSAEIREAMAPYLLTQAEVRDEVKGWLNQQASAFQAAYMENNFLIPHA